MPRKRGVAPYERDLFQGWRLPALRRPSVGGGLQGKGSGGCERMKGADPERGAQRAGRNGTGKLLFGSGCRDNGILGPGCLTL
jgi:hypothetical protein